MSKIQTLSNKHLIQPPKWLPSNVHYETIMGSVAYGVSSDTSDMDVYGFCIPPKEIIFPHLAGEIQGFGRQKKNFEQFQEHGIKDNVPGLHHCPGDKTYDLSIYNIVKYFSLCMENNPNMIDSLFTPDNCVLHITSIGTMVREKRNMFLHKGAWHKFKGYAYSQMHKMKNKNPEGKRLELVEKYGYDTKFAYHVVRLLNEVEIILSEGTLDLQRNREQLKSIRRGDWSEQDILDYFNRKELGLEELYQSSKLRYAPDEEAIKALLLNCLEHHYGSLDKCVVKVGVAESYLDEISTIVDKWKIVQK